MQNETSAFHFEVRESKNNFISEMFGVPQERAEEMHKTFSETLKRLMSDKQHQLDKRDVVIGFTSAAQNDQEVHYAIFQAGAKSEEVCSSPSLGKGLAALLHVLSHH